MKKYKMEKSKRIEEYENKKDLIRKYAVNSREISISKIIDSR